VILVSLVFLFSTFQMEEELHCCLASMFNEKEYDNDANRKVRNCLEKSKTTPTSTTLAANQPAFRNGSLSGSGIGSHLHRIVLDHYVEL
jgi:hypothetical protein